MLKKITVGVSALAMAAFAGSAMAQNLIYNPDPAVVEIEVTVQEIAHLQVIDATGSMVIDDNTDTFMGNPSSSSSSFSAANLAVLRLNTNFNVSSVNFTYDKVNNVQGDHGNPSLWFGRADCATTCGLSSGMGVWPQAGILDSATGNIIGGGGGMAGNDSSSETAPLVRTNTGGGAFGNGTHYIGVGVSTKWDRALSGEPTFVNPGTYMIPISAVIVP